jgi:hypothetical protein
MYIPSIVHRIPVSLYPCKYFSFFNFDCSCELISLCGSDLCFSNDWWCSSYIFVYLLWWNVYSSPLFFNQIILVIIVELKEFFLYILGINILPDLWCTNTFSYSIGCFFTVGCVLSCIEVFLFWWSPTYLFLLLCIFSVPFFSQEISAKFNVIWNFFPKTFIGLGHIVRV